MISQKKLLLLVSFSAALWIIYQLIFVLPELMNAWALITKYPGNSGASQAFSEVFGGFIIQTFFLGSVALWSFNEAFEKEVLTSTAESSKRNSALASTKQTSVTFEKEVGQIDYAKIMKPLSIIFIVASIGFLLWTIYNMFFNIFSYESNFGELIKNLLFFAVSAIIGAALWSKSNEETETRGKNGPPKNFRQEYEEQKKREMEDRL